MPLSQAKATVEILCEAFKKGYFTTTNNTQVMASAVDFVNNKAYFTIGYNEDNKEKYIAGIELISTSGLSRLGEYDIGFFDEITSERITLDEALNRYNH